MITYDTDLILRDASAKGWLPTDLAKAAKVSDMTVSRFLRRLGRQTPRTAGKLAAALNHPLARYQRTAREALAS